MGAIGLTVWFGSAAPDPQPSPLPQLEQTVNTSDEQMVPVVEPSPAIEPVADPAPASVTDTGGADTGAGAMEPAVGGTTGNPNSGPGNSNGNGNGNGNDNDNGSGNGNGKGSKG